MKNDLPIQVNVPPKAVLRAVFERFFASLPDDELAKDIPPGFYGDVHFPSIGEKFEGGLYAGLTLHDNAPMALVLLPDEVTEISWKSATSWAETVGGALPSRMDMLVLFKNLPAAFQKEWYWTSEVLADSGDYAWMQHFGDGYQGGDLKSNEYRARAVRRVAL